MQAEHEEEKVKGEKAMEVEISERYVASKKDYWDYYSTMKTSFDKGREEGLAEGHAEGRAERSVEIARSLKKKGLSTTDISEVTGLTAGDIAAL